MSDERLAPATEIDNEDVTVFGRTGCFWRERAALLLPWVHVVERQGAEVIPAEVDLVDLAFAERGKRSFTCAERWKSTYGGSTSAAVLSRLHHGMSLYWGMPC
jgi:hypothetical protein